ncbi:MAG: sugar-transfer associated ATP-grasp domain-containing protein [Bacteroidota bacterium]
MLGILKNKTRIKQQVLGINQRNAALVYRYNHRKDYKLADDKVLSKTLLDKAGIACADTYAVIERIGDIPTIWATLQRYDKLAIKPANGSGGGGIKILVKDEQDRWQSSGKPVDASLIFQHMANIIMGIYSLGGKDRVLIEYCITPHTFFQEIYPAGVPDFRVILLEAVPLMAMLRVPTDQSDGKANLHQGGLGIGIDMERGVLTQGFDGQHYHDYHPDNQHNIRDKCIPMWDELLRLSVATAEAFPLRYLGVDIVLDQELGPLVMEVNVRPGLSIQKVNKTGMKAALRDHSCFAEVLV